MEKNFNENTGANLILTERLEQINKHNYKIEDDLKHENGELLQFAKYLIEANDSNFPKGFTKDYVKKMHFKSRIEQLSIAGAFIAAEIDRRIFLINNNQLDEKFR